MATTKIKNIKSTLKKAIDYILNPEKTEDGKLVYSFGCSVGTADLEMQMTANKGRKVGNRVAYHLIQSFAPEDPITPEKALEIGIEYAKEFTQGKHEFVITTHVDKDHLHNHIIFNATNFIDYKKYQYGFWEKKCMRSINDRLCKENGLSIINNTSGIRGKGKWEYEQSKKGNSWKDKFRNDIDNVINNAETFEDFVLKMELDGYTIRHKKVVSFKDEINGPIRGDRLGEAYTKDAILDRIENKEKSIYQENLSNKMKRKNDNYQKKKFKNTNINLLVDISKNIKAQQSPGYEHALVRANINTLNKTFNFLIKNKIKTTDELFTYDERLDSEYKFLRKSYKDLNNKMIGLSEKIKFTQNYKKNQNIYKQSLKNENKNAFFAEHQEEIISYKTACIFFEKNNISPTTLNLSTLFEEYRSTKLEKNQICENLNKSREDLKELQTVKQNISETLSIDFNEIKELKNKDNIDISNL